MFRLEGRRFTPSRSSTGFPGQAETTHRAFWRKCSARSRGLTDFGAYDALELSGPFQPPIFRARSEDLRIGHPRSQGWTTLLVSRYHWYLGTSTACIHAIGRGVSEEEESSRVNTTGKQCRGFPGKHQGQGLTPDRQETRLASQNKMEETQGSAEEQVQQRSNSAEHYIREQGKVTPLPLSNRKQLRRQCFYCINSTKH